MARGGYRPGAGRKALGDKREATLSGVRVTRAKLEVYHQAAVAREVTLTEWVETTLDREAASGRKETP